MRISKEAAVDNKARVLEVAKRLLREKGFSGLGVAEVMKEAGFTHGGFYNHFGSKENLAVEAVQSAFDEAVSRVAAKAAEARNPRRRREAFRHYVDRYLSITTRDAPGRACPMAALGTDAARHGQALKAPFAKGVERYLEAFAGVVPDADGQSSTRQTAIMVISTLIGALTLSRACAGVDDELSEEILSVVHKQLLKS
jgi:TetR/AcrR family transcriptional regulator, transcriptional repressor for nem operon